MLCLFIVKRRQPQQSGWHHYRLARSGPAHEDEGSSLLSWLATIGSVKKKVEPTFSRDSNQSCPPCRSTSSRQMYSPSPVPLIPHAWALSARVKRPKI